MRLLPIPPITSEVIGGLAITVCWDIVMCTFYWSSVQINNRGGQIVWSNQIYGYKVAIV